MSLCCVNSCSGVFVTSFEKSETNENIHTLAPLYGDYKRYKKITPYPSGYPGKYIYYIACF